MENQLWYRYESLTQAEQKIKEERQQIEDEQAMRSVLQRPEKRKFSNSSESIFSESTSVHESVHEFTPVNMLVCEANVPDNRWRDCHKAVDFDTELTDFKGCFERLKMFDQSPKLKLTKVKVYGSLHTLTASRMKRLLKELAFRKNLEYLDIDLLLLRQGECTDYTFYNLKCLMVNSVTVVDGDGRVVRNAKRSRASIRLNTLKLKKIYFGQDSIEFVEIVNKLSVLYLNVDRDEDGKLGEFKNLQTLVCNQALAVNRDELFLRVRDSLRELELNVCRMETTGDAPTKAEIEALQEYLDYICDPKEEWTDNFILRVHGIQLDLYDDNDLSEFGLHDSVLHLADRHGWVDLHGTVLDTSYDRVVSPFSAKCEDVHKLDFARSLSEPAFGRFSKCFPNIQHVSLYNSEAKEVCWNSFIDFLTTCKALVSLKTTSSGFSAAQYETLADLPAVRSVMFLCVYEPQMPCRQMEDFNFLSHFKHLRAFSTNLAVRQKALQLIVDHFKPHSRFSFLFNTKKRESFNIMYVQPNDQQPGHYDLQLSNSHQSGRSKWKRNLSLIDLANCVTIPKSFKIPESFFDHWLETVAKTKDPMGSDGEQMN